MINNVLIIGGGISSLYSAYLLKKNYPKIKYTIIEKSDECGGRVKMSNLEGVKLHTGAYFTRVDKDKILGKLLKDLDINLNPYVLDIVSRYGIAWDIVILPISISPRIIQSLC